MIRFLILIAVFYVFYRAVKTWMLKTSLKSDQTLSGDKQAKIDDVMIKDPYCNVYFPKRKGVAQKIDGEKLYFCSKECRDKYIIQKSNNQD